MNHMTIDMLKWIVHWRIHVKFIFITSLCRNNRCQKIFLLSFISGLVRNTMHNWVIVDRQCSVKLLFWYCLTFLVLFFYSLLCIVCCFHAGIRLFSFHIFVLPSNSLFVLFLSRYQNQPSFLKSCCSDS